MLLGVDKAFEIPTACVELPSSALPWYSIFALSQVSIDTAPGRR